jgi:hypothetical protein
MDVAAALSLLLLPPAFLAYWHRREWGGGFGRASGIWTLSGILAVAVLLCYVGLICVLGRDLHLIYDGAGFRRGRTFFYLFCLPGIGLGIAIFPGAASTLSGFYLQLAQAGATKVYPAVGWFLVLIWLMLLALNTGYRF